MTDGSIREIPIALVSHTTTLPKIMYSPRSNLILTATVSKTGVTCPENSKTTSSKKEKVEEDRKSTQIKGKPDDCPVKEKQNLREFSNQKHDESIKAHSNSKKADDKSKDRSRHPDSPGKSRKHVPNKRRSRSRSKNRSVSSRKDIKKTAEVQCSKDKKSERKEDLKQDRSNRDRDRKESESHSESTKKPKDKTIDGKVESKNSIKDAAKDKRNASSSEQRSSFSKRTENRKEAGILDKNRRSSTKEKLTETKKVADKLEKSINLETKVNDHGSHKSSRDQVDKGKEPHRPCDGRSRDDTSKKSTKKEQHSSKNLLKSDSKTTKVKHEQKLTLSFADELPEVQGLKPAEDENPSPIENKTFFQKEPKEKPPVVSNSPVLTNHSEDTKEKSRSIKKSDHAEMLKQVESNVEEILAPLSEIEKLALDRNSLKPEDLLNKMMDLFTPDKKNIIEVKKSKNNAPKDSNEGQTFSLYDPIDTELVDVKLFSHEAKESDESVAKVPVIVKLESEYETFINSLTSVDGNNQPVVGENAEHPEMKPKKKKSRSSSQSTSSSYTSGTTTSSTNDSSSESSSSSDSDDSSNSSSSESSDTESESSDSNESEDKGKNVEVKEKKIESPSQTPPRPLKIETTVSSSTVGAPDTGLVPLPEHRETPIKIQMNLIQKVYTINKQLSDNEDVSCLCLLLFYSR